MAAEADDERELGASYRKVGRNVSRFREAAGEAQPVSGFPAKPVSGFP
jgi:hypothetical protein